jgi:hypothetical protein
MRVAVSLLYGETAEERLAALTSPEPLRLPWISTSLDQLSMGLTELALVRRSAVRERHPALVPTPCHS